VLDATAAENFSIKDIPGHGNATYRFHVTSAAKTVKNTKTYKPVDDFMH